MKSDATYLVLGFVGIVGGSTLAWWLATRPQTPAPLPVLPEPIPALPAPRRVPAPVAPMPLPSSSLSSVGVPVQVGSSWSAVEIPVADVPDHITRELTELNEMLRQPTMPPCVVYDDASQRACLQVLSDRMAQDPRTLVLPVPSRVQILRMRDERPGELLLNLYLWRNALTSGSPTWLSRLAPW